MRVHIGPYRNNVRIERVDIRPYDTWDLFTTLALVITPALKDFRARSRSCPATEVPVEDYDDMKADEYGNDPFQDDTGKWWSYDLDRWYDILDQMIFSFEKVQTDWEEEFYDFGDTDMEGKAAMGERIQEGLNLFAKYYTSLWI